MFKSSNIFLYYYFRKKVAYYKSYFKDKPLKTELYFLTYSLTKSTLAWTDFCAVSPCCSVTLLVGKNSKCDADAVPGLIKTLWENNCATKLNLSWSFWRALVAAWFSCWGVKGGITTGGGGGAWSTPLFFLLPPPKSNTKSFYCVIYKRINCDKYRSISQNNFL